MSNNVSNTSPTGLYNTYILPAFAAGAGVPLAMWSLERKSALQIGAAAPGLGTMRDAIWRGYLAAPTVAKIVGTQKLIQSLTTEGAQAAFGLKPDSAVSVVASTFFGAALTSGYYADFNKSTMTGETKPVTHRQRGAIVGREMPFLAIDPLCTAMQKRYGGNPISDSGCAFASGAMGSLTGHLQDTALTRMQKGLDIMPRVLPEGTSVMEAIRTAAVNQKLPEKLVDSVVFAAKTLPKGMVSRAVGLGTFNLVYQGVKKLYKLEEK